MTSKFSLKIVYLTLGLLILTLISMVSYFVHVSNIQEEQRIAHNNKILLKKYTSNAKYIAYYNNILQQNAGNAKLLKRVTRGDRVYEMVEINGELYMRNKITNKILEMPYAVIYQDMGAVLDEFVNDKSKPINSYTPDSDPRIQMDYTSPYKRDYIEATYKLEKEVHN